MQIWKTIEMILTLLILTKILYVGADTLHPSCYFNPLCTCSRVVPNLGVVSCVNVPLPRIPLYVNRSKINSFDLENNGLKAIEPQFLSGTGMYTCVLTFRCHESIIYTI